MNVPSWLKPLGFVLVVLIVALFLAGALAVPYRFTRPPEGYDQSRVHFNTKNSTRFNGANPAEVAALVGRAVYPATTATNTPDVIILYNEEDWQGGLAVTPLLRPLNALLLPASVESDRLTELNPAGSDHLDGTQLLLVNDASAPDTELTTQSIAPADVPNLLTQLDAAPRHVLIVDENEPATALLAAPWAVYSGDLIVFELEAAPTDLPRYTLGDISVAGATQIRGSSPTGTAIAFAKPKFRTLPKE